MRLLHPSVGGWVLISLLFCSPPERNLDEKKFIQAAAIFYLVERSHSNPPLDSSECTRWSRTNREFNNRYRSFLKDQKEYTNLILGDSTMDISGRYEGFLDPDLTQNLAVGGNNLCDMNRQLFVANSKSPENILISTPGGNDILQEVSLENRIRSMELLLDRIQKRFPQVRISVVAVHPTQIDFVNQTRALHNQEMWNTLLSKWDNSKLCWVDPLPLFGSGNLGPSDPAPDENMIQLPNGVIDKVHYNEEISFAIKAKLESDCNLFL